MAGAIGSPAELRATGTYPRRSAPKAGSMKLPWFGSWFGRIPEDPFYRPRKPLWLPPEMANPPGLDERPPAGPPARRHALLINPFYAKSPHGSFGKHVLTPTLALTSIAGATPPHWQVRYWDENLLQGPPPADPLPEVVGISVHLTFAKRAYDARALVSCPRQQGCSRRPAHPILPGRSRAARRRARHWRRRATVAEDPARTLTAGP